MKVYKEDIEFIRLIGKDVKDFLQRTSSNDFEKFDSNSSFRTVLINDKGRIVDLISVLNIDNMFVLVPSVGRERLVEDFLKKYIVTEEIEIAYTQCAKYTLIPEFESDNEFLSGCNFVEGNYFYTDEFRFKKLIIIALNDKSDFTQVLIEHIALMSDEDFKNFAISRAYLYDSNELNEDINPLECGLKEYISFTKGCYIGQEVIAKVDTKGKSPKLMVQINADFAMKAGDKIYYNLNGKEMECGFVSSAGKGDGDYTALGFIKGINFKDKSKYYLNSNADNVILINKIKY